MKLSLIGRSSFFKLLLVCCLAVFICVGCGGGGKSSGAAPDNNQTDNENEDNSGANPTLSSITVSPANPNITVGDTQQFNATGTYSDNTTKNLTDSVTWTSSSTAVATIASGGFATAVKAGITTITATSGSVSGVTTLAVDSNNSDNSMSYLLILKDGDRIKSEAYSVTKRDGLPDITSTLTNYLWCSGHSTVSEVDTLKLYNFSKGFDNYDEYSISNIAYINGQLRIYKTYVYSKQNSLEFTNHFSPYWISQANVEPDQMVNYSYTFTNMYYDNTIVNVSISDVQYAGITTRYGYYPDCLKYTITTNQSTLPEPLVENYWLANGIGTVAIESSGTGWKTFTEYKYTFY